MTNIWYRYEDRKPEKVDRCKPCDVEYILANYMLAFSLCLGQHRFRKDKLWAGRKCDEPKE